MSEPAEKKENVAALENGNVEITLSDGRKAVVREGKFKDSSKATVMANGVEGDYMSCLMSLLVTIDGKAIVKEELDELKMKDGNDIQYEFSKLNF